MILSLDTTQRLAKIATHSLQSNTPLHHMEVDQKLILSAIHEITAGETPQLIALNNGPGSFIGTRLATNIAQTYQLVKKIPWVAFPAWHIIAEAAQEAVWVCTKDKGIQVFVSRWVYDQRPLLQESYQKVVLKEEKLPQNYMSSQAWISRNLSAYPQICDVADWIETSPPIQALGALAYDAYHQHHIQTSLMIPNIYNTIF